MIRRHKIKSKVPKKLIKSLMRDYYSWMHMGGWNQIDGSYYPELMSAVYASVGITNPDCYGMIFHLFTGSIYSHYDRMDKTCLLVPLKTTKTMKFHEEDQVVNFEMDKYLSFNDFNRHGLINENCGYGLVASISKDYHTYKKMYKSRK